MSTSAPRLPVPTEVVDNLVRAVAAGMAELVAIIPARPAEVLGRLSVPVDPAEERQRILRHTETDYPIRRDWPHEGQSKVSSAFDRLPETLVERILGALELRIADLTLDPPPPAAALAELAGPPSQVREYITIEVSGQSEAKPALDWVERLRPGAVTFVEALARALAERSEVVARLQVRPDVTEEKALLAAHGAAHLALATVTATAVLRATDLDGRPDPAGIVGVALGVAVRLLQDAPLPSHYPDALLACRRAEYRFGFHCSGWSVQTRNHQLALVEGEPPETVDFSANGLVVPVSDGVVVRTGTADGHVGLEFRVTEDAPAFDPDQRWGDDPAAVERILADLDFDAGDPVALGMKVVERFTGVSVTPDMLAARERVWVIEPVLDDLPTHAEWWHSALFCSGYRDVAAAINALPTDELRRLAQRAALEAVAAAGLEDHAEVQAGIALFGQPSSRPTAEFERFVRHVNADAAKRKDEDWIYNGPGIAVTRIDGPKTREGWKRSAAVKAIRHALNPDPLTAALEAVNSARFAFPENQDEFLDRIRSAGP